MTFIVFVGVFFVIGFPLSIGFYLFLHRKELYAVRVTDKIGFLYDRFHKGAEFWELHELVRKVLLTGVAVTLADNPTFQVLTASIVCVVAQVNLNYFKPHKNHIVYFIGQTCFSAITMKYLVALLLTGNEEASHDPTLGTFLIAIDMCCTGFGGLGIMLAGWVLWVKVRAIKKQSDLEEGELLSKNNTKVVPVVSEDEERELLLKDRSVLMEELTTVTTMPVVSMTEKTLRFKLTELVDVDKQIYDILMKKLKYIDDLHVKLKIIEKQIENKSQQSANNTNNPNNNFGQGEGSMEDQLAQLKTQLRIAQQNGAGLSASGVGQRATTLITLLRQLFRKFDPNATGHLGKPELRDLFLHVMSDTSANRRSAEADAMTVITSVDTDGNGTVEENEFVEWIQKGIAIPYEKRMEWGAANKVQGRLLAFLTAVITYCQDNYLRSIFLEFDRDQDGALSKTELVALMVEMKMRSVTQSDLSNSLKSIASDAGIVLLALDSNGNGTIELEELTDWLVEGLSRPLEERKKFALQGGVYKRLEIFLLSVEETAEKSGLSQWRWALKNNERGLFVAKKPEPPKHAPEEGPKPPPKAAIFHQKSKKKAKIGKKKEPPPPKKKEAIPHQKKKSGGGGGGGGGGRGNRCGKILFGCQ